MRARRGNEVRREFLGNDGNKSNVTPSERGRRRRLSSRGPAAHGKHHMSLCAEVRVRATMAVGGPRRRLLVPAAARLTRRNLSSCGEPITCHRQLAGKWPTLLNADCERKQEGTENIRGSNTLPCGGSFLPNISRQSLGPTDRADICRREKKKNNNKKKEEEAAHVDLLASPLCLPERRSVREVHSVCLFFFFFSCTVLSSCSSSSS